MSESKKISAGRSGTLQRHTGRKHVFVRPYSLRSNRSARRYSDNGKSGLEERSTCGADYAPKKCPLLDRCSIFEAPTKPEADYAQLPPGYHQAGPNLRSNDQ